MIWVYLYTPSGPYSKKLLFPIVHGVNSIQTNISYWIRGYSQTKPHFQHMARGMVEDGCLGPLSRGPRDGPFLDFLGITGSMNSSR